MPERLAQRPYERGSLLTEQAHATSICEKKRPSKEIPIYSDIKKPCKTRIGTHIAICQYILAWARFRKHR